MSRSKVRGGEPTTPGESDTHIVHKFAHARFFGGENFPGKITCHPPAIFPSLRSALGTRRKTPMKIQPNKVSRFFLRVAEGALLALLFSAFFASATLPALAASPVAVPFSDDFSSWAAGALPSDFPAETLPAGGVFIGADSSGNHTLGISGATPSGGAAYDLSAAGGTILWAGAKARVPATETPLVVFDLDGAFVAFVKESASTGRLNDTFLLNSPADTEDAVKDIVKNNNCKRYGCKAKRFWSDPYTNESIYKK